MRPRWRWGLVFLTVMAACAPDRGPRDWTSIPRVQTEENGLFDVRLEPLKKDKRFFVSFRLKIANKTQRDLAIDWNKTRYIHNGQPKGVFAFPGIDPASIKKAIPPDTVAPGSVFSREIFPAHWVAFAPMREEVLNKEGKGLFPGPLPEGQNGIRLVIRQGAKETVRDVTVEIQ